MAMKLCCLNCSNIVDVKRIQVHGVEERSFGGVVDEIIEAINDSEVYKLKITGMTCPECDFEVDNLEIVFEGGAKWPTLEEMEKLILSGGLFYQVPEAVVNLVALYVGDGYLAGATDNPRGDEPCFWPEEMREGEWTLVQLREVPEDLAAKLVAQGASDQFFSDGYDAANFAAEYVGDEIIASTDLE